MFHCHILEHAELEIMADLVVSEDPNAAAPAAHVHDGP
jgi:hypothetical protein